MRTGFLFAVLFAVGCGREKPIATEPEPPAPGGEDTERLTAPDEPWTRNFVTVTAQGADVEDDDDILVVRVVVENDSDAKPLNLSSWRAKPASATLRDSAGRTLRPTPKGTVYEDVILAEVKRRLAPASLSGSGPVQARPRMDYLLFEKPGRSAEYLDLDLDAKNVGQSGTIRFRIPREVWQPAPAAPKKKK